MKDVKHNLFFRLIRNLNILKYIILGILCGLFSFLFINSVTRLISMIIANDYDNSEKEQVIIFSSIILIYIWLRRTLSLKIITLTQKIFWQLRLEILSVVLKTKYNQFHGKKDQIHSAIINDVGVLASASTAILDFLTSLIIALASLVYLSVISFKLFLLTIFVSILAIAIYSFNAQVNFSNLELARKLEVDFSNVYRSMLDGFKEIYMEPKKGAYLFEKKIKSLASDSTKLTTIAFTGILNNSITGQILFYILISSILLFLSSVLKIKPSEVVSFVFTLLYLYNSLEIIMTLIPGLMKAQVAYKNLINLKEELNLADINPKYTNEKLQRYEFNNITLTGIRFQYPRSSDFFEIGPIEFNMQKGDVIFIYGGNGSGKTTFINSLIGLCEPTFGKIALNDIEIVERDYISYRALFSVVFNDFYLFDELIGIDSFQFDKWNNYLELFEIKAKVQLKGNKFVTTDLSTGQRKRLALVVSLMEDKPILVLDEWAADQDPNFRKKFYTQIIPILKALDFTIIAITHDDNYYHCADKIFKMEYGKLINENSVDASTPKTKVE